MTTLSAAAPPPLAAAARLRDHLPLAVGSVALVTLAAFEDRAVGTALPSVVQQFHAMSAFGLANAAPAASYLLAVALAGAWTDRRGPLPALRVAVVVFGIAQAAVGLATSMPWVIAGRALSGAAEALFDVSLMVLVARALPERLRPRMFSLFAAAWVLPSVLGPAVTGVVTERLGWRWVFLGGLVLLVPTWLMLRGAVRRTAPTAPTGEAADAQRAPGSARWAAGAAVSVFVLTLAGAQLTAHPGPAGILLGLAALGLAGSATRLLPRGTLRARPGLPALLAVRALTTAGFSTGAFLPLLMTVLHGFAPSVAGVSLSITGVMWATGSWLQGRDHTLSRTVLLRSGLVLMTCGLAVATLLTLPGLSPAWGLSGWAMAGLGMGLTSPSLSVLVLALSADHEQGRSSGAAQTAMSTSSALAFAFGGTLLALAAPAPGRAEFAAVIAAGTASALAALLVSRRIGPVGAVGDRRE